MMNKFSAKLLVSRKPAGLVGVATDDIGKLVWPRKPAGMASRAGQLRRLERPGRKCSRSSPGLKANASAGSTDPFPRPT